MVGTLGLRPAISGTLFRARVIRSVGDAPGGDARPPQRFWQRFWQRFFLLRSARFLLSIAVSGRQAGIPVDAFGSWELVA